MSDNTLWVSMSNILTVLVQAKYDSQFTGRDEKIERLASKRSRLFDYMTHLIGTQISIQVFHVK